MGPDVRWVGTESGYGRETEWSVVPYALANQNKIAEGSQQTMMKEGFIPPGDMMDQDLGSRMKIKEAKNLIWYPSEVDVSIRPGWFWHENENDRVKSPEKLLDIYFSSVGRNSLLLLNIPPDSLGLINDADVRSLKEWQNAIHAIFKNNMAVGADIKTNNKTVTINTLTDENDSTSWSPVNADSYSIELTLKIVSDFDVLLLQENIRIGQRIEHFTLEALINNEWKKVTEGTTVGYKRLLRFPMVHTNKVRLTINECRLTPALAEFGLYRQLPAVSANPPSAAFRESVEVNLKCDEKGAEIYYTTDGSIPAQNSHRYIKPLKLAETTNLRFIAIRKDGTSGFAGKASYQKAKYGITLSNAPDEKYTGGGPLGLVDGVTGTIDFNDGHWSGFNGTDMEAIIDLGAIRELHDFGINFNENTKSWIFRPGKAEFLVSENGIDYKTIFIKSYNKPENDTEQLIHLEFKQSCKARYVKVKATNSGKMPEWHPAKGEPSWIFVDEVFIN
jgi:alpha-L-fucosidase